MTGKYADSEKNSADHGDGGNNCPREIANVCFERSFGINSGDLFSDTANHRAKSCRHYNRPTISGNDMGTLPNHILLIRRGKIISLKNISIFIYRLGFSGKGSFVYFELLGSDNPTICGDSFSFFEN